MSTTFRVGSDQDSETFLVNEWHYHPVYNSFYIFRNGDNWLSLGSRDGPIGNINVSQLPPDQWVALQDNRGSPLPVAVYVERFGNVHGRWLSAQPAQPAQPSGPPLVQSNAGAGASGLDMSALFNLAPRQETSVPPAFQSAVDDFIDFVGCVLGIVLSQRQLDALRAAGVQALSQPGSGEGRIIEANVAEFQKVKTAADGQARFAFRQQNEAPFVQWLTEHQNESALWQMLGQWYREARQVIATADGTLPLTREAAESAVELIAFATLVAQGKEPGTEMHQDHEAEIAQLARNYPTLPMPQQMWIAFAPVTLYELRRMWPTLSPQQREGYRMQFANQFGLPPAQASQSPGGYQAPQPAAPAAQTRSGSPTDWEQLRRADDSIESLQEQLSAAMAKGDQRESARLQQKIKNALNNEAVAASMLSNIADMRHQSLMRTAGNIKF